VKVGAQIQNELELSWNSPIQIKTNFTNENQKYFVINLNNTQLDAKQFTINVTMERNMKVVNKMNI
jgi:hypothetical protein